MKRPPTRGADQQSAADPSRFLHLLGDLLVSVFDEGELRRFIARLPDGRKLSRQLPGRSVSLDELAHGAVELLFRHGRLDEDFFRALRGERPAYKREIAMIANAWSDSQAWCGLIMLCEASVAWHHAKGRPHADAVPRLLREAPASYRAVSRADHLFEIASLFLPARVADEELGDALEDIHRRVERGCLAWKIYLRVITAILWATRNAIKGWRPGRDKKGA